MTLPYAPNQEVCVYIITTLINQIKVNAHALVMRGKVISNAKLPKLQPLIIVLYFFVQTLL